MGASTAVCTQKRWCTFVLAKCIDASGCTSAIVDGFDEPASVCAPAVVDGFDKPASGCTPAVVDEPAPIP